MEKFDIKLRILRPTVLKWIFILGDIFSFLLQTTGGGLATSQSTATTGANLLLTGLCVSLCVFVFFLGTCLYIHWQVRNSDLFSNKWRVTFGILYLDMMLLIIRSCYRIAEYSNLQFQNPISTNETYFYTFDTMLMLLLSYVWIAFHPGVWRLFNAEDSNSSNI